MKCARSTIIRAAVETFFTIKFRSCTNSNKIETNACTNNIVTRPTTQVVSLVNAPCLQIKCKIDFIISNYVCFCASANYEFKIFYDSVYGYERHLILCIKRGIFRIKFECTSPVSVATIVIICTLLFARSGYPIFMWNGSENVYAHKYVE